MSRNLGRLFRTRAVPLTCLRRAVAVVFTNFLVRLDILEFLYGEMDCFPFCKMRYKATVKVTTKRKYTRPYHIFPSAEKQKIPPGQKIRRKR